MNEAVYREILRRLGIDLPLSPETQCGRGPTSPAGWVHSRRSSTQRLAATSRRRDRETGAPRPIAPATINRELAAFRKA